MQSNKAKLTYKTELDGTVSLEDLDGDMTAGEFARLCARLALAAGYCHNSVMEAFNMGEDEILGIADDEE